jgi:hypothetical protein
MPEPGAKTLPRSRFGLAWHMWLEACCRPTNKKTAAGIAPGRGVLASAWVSFATDENVSSSTQAKVA